MAGIQGLAAPLQRPATTTVLASLAAVVSIGSAGAAVALHPATPGVVSPGPADLVVATAFPLVAVLVLAHQPRNLVGWLLLTCASMGPYLLAGQYAARTHDDPTLLTGLAAWFSVWGFVSYFMLWALTPLHFPDGELPSPRWRPVRRVLVALLVALTVARMFAPVESDTWDRIDNPLGLDGWEGFEALNVVTLASAMGLVFVGGVVGVAAVVVRARHTRGAERQRMLWLLLGVAWLVVANALQLALEGSGAGGDLWFVLGMVGLVVALGVGVIRHELFDVGEGLRRGIVNGVLVALLGVAALAVLGAAGAGDQPQRVALAALAVVALLAAAAHDQLQQVVDRVVVGQRQDPEGVLTSLRRRLDLASGPMDALGQLAQGVSDTLRLPYVRIEGDAGFPPISSGTPTDETTSFPVTEGVDRLGTLTVGHRATSARFTRRERRTLEAVAGQVATLLRQASLSAEVQGQREQVVTAREDERRRLRRDLHDGVGPSLAGIAMQLDGLAGRLAEHPDLAARVEAARDDLRRTVGSVRRMVDGLRPPALDDMGLDGALRQLVDRYEGRASLRCDVPPDLPAAVESAAYLITAEALTNAMRHSGCGHCQVELGPDAPWLVITVADDGEGIPESAPRGVGLTSMRDRAAEVGGLLEVTTTAHGTVVRAHLPLEARS
jgi:signal transduction histidine kinase